MNKKGIIIIIAIVILIASFLVVDYGEVVPDNFNPVDESEREEYCSMEHQLELYKYNCSEQLYYLWRQPFVDGEQIDHLGIRVGEDVVGIITVNQTTGMMEFEEWILVDFE